MIQQANRDRGPESRNIDRVYAFAESAMTRNTNLAYHNFAHHAVPVALSAYRLAEVTDVGSYAQHLLVVGGLTHDIYACPGSSDNESRTAAYVSGVLPHFGYTDTDIRIVQGLITATKMPQQPDGELEKIICDADLHNLATYGFWQSGEWLRQEMGIPLTPAWYQGQLVFLSQHQYHTNYAKEHWQPGVELNKALVGAIVESGQAPRLDELGRFDVKERLYPSYLRT